LRWYSINQPLSSTAPAPVETPMEISEEEQSSSAVVTIGDGSSSGPVPAFTLRIGDIVATAPIINFPPAPSSSQPPDDYSRYSSASTMLKNFNPGSAGQNEPVLVTTQPRSPFDFLTTLGMSQAAAKSSAASKRGSFSGLSGAQAFSTINTSFVESSGRPVHVEPPEFTLSNLLEQLEDYTPTVPDTVANHFLHTAGFDSTDPRISRLLSLVAQKFVYDIMKDSLVVSKAKAAAAAAVSGKAKPKDAKQVLKYEDLNEAAKEYNIKFRKPFPFK